MDLAEYLSRVEDGFEFLIALASLIGFLGLIFGIFIMMFGGLSKNTSIKMIIISIFLLGLTGMYTGVKYFWIK